MELWAYLPEPGTEPEAIAELAVAVEQCGFTGLALMDHLVTPLAWQRPVFESMTLLTWLAARTTTLRLGHLVLCDAFRHPAVLAKQAVTLDHLSGGRFELGIGWGSQPTELVGYGVTDDGPAARVARLDHSLGVIRALWSGEATPDGTMVQRPLPLGRIPIVVGGVGRKTLGVVREHADWWNVPVPDLARLDELRPQAGDARVSIQLALKVVADCEDEGVARERIVARMGDFGDGLLVGRPAEFRERIEAFAQRGVERVYLWPLGRPTPALLADLAAGLR